jgi:tetratricopeptide (TPR) repeat protein
MKTLRFAAILSFVTVFTALSHAQNAAHFVRSGDEALKALDAKSALRSYREAEQRAPNDAAVLCRLSKLFLDFTVMNSGDKLNTSYHKPAFDYAIRAVQWNGNSAEALSCVANCYLTKGRYAAARERFELYRKAFSATHQALKHDPSNADAKLAAARCHRMYASEHWAVRAAMRVWLNWHPDASLEKAEVLAREVLVNDPAKIRALHELAQIVLARDKTEDGKNILRQIGSIRPQEPIDRFLQLDADRMLAKNR